MQTDDLLTTKQAARLLGVSMSWLAKARMKGRGPGWVALPPRLVRYRRSVLIQYIEENSHRSTSARTVAERRRQQQTQPTLSR